MGKGSKSSALFKDKAKNRVDDLEGMFINLQYARKESRTYDAGVLEEQVHQMLREWKAELNEPSPASSLQGGSRISSDLYRLLLGEEEDDATSALAAAKPDPDAQKHDVTGFQEALGVGYAECSHRQISHFLIIGLAKKTLLFSFCWTKFRKMLCPPCRVMVLIICIGFLSIQPEKVSALRSIDLALRWGENLFHLRSSRILEAAVVQDLHTQLNIAPAPLMTFDPNQSDKRRVKRGSDPIHNKC